jgi:hypothetical protein
MGLSLLCGYSIWLGAGSYEMSVRETPVAAGDVVLPPRSKEVEVPGRHRRGHEWSALQRQRAYRPVCLSEATGEGYWRRVSLRRAQLLGRYDTRAGALNRQ